MATRTTKSNPNQNGRADHAATPFGLDESRIRDAHADHMAVDVPPHNPSHEQAVLGAVMFAADELDGVRRVLPDPRAFYSESHRNIYRAICSLADDGSDYASYDAVLVADRMERLEYATDRTTRDLLRSMESPSDAHNATHYARLVQADFMRRQVMKVTRQAYVSATDPTRDVGEMLVSLTQEAERIGEASEQTSYLTWTAATLAAADLPPILWIIVGFMRAKETGVVGGPMKAGKTSLICELAVAVATGTKFIGMFDVPKAMRVMLLLGETYPADVRQKLDRAAGQRGLSLAEIGDMLHIHAGKLPQLPNASHLKQLSRDIKRASIDLVLIDPAYLCLGATDMSQLTEVGPLIRALGDACKPATVVFAHHLKKGETKLQGIPDLSSLAGAGIGESVGQWVLLRREGEFTHCDDQNIVVGYGSRGGGGGRLAVHFVESTGAFTSSYLPDDDESREERERVAAQAKSDKFHRGLNSARAAITKALRDTAYPIPSRDLDADAKRAEPTVTQNSIRAARKNMANEWSILHCEFGKHPSGHKREGFILREDRERFKNLGAIVSDEDSVNE